MHCQTLQHPEFSSPVFVCGTRPPKRYCRFCLREGHRAEARALCDWPMPKPIHVRTAAAEVGDVWITQQGRKRGRIVEIQNLCGDNVVTDGLYFARMIWVQIPGHKTPYPYHRVNGDTFLSERPGLCSAPVCYRHRRHVGPNRDYCMSHWRSWEAIS